jgi:hypothetical protein
MEELTAHLNLKEIDETQHRSRRKLRWDFLLLHKNGEVRTAEPASVEAEGGARERNDAEGKTRWRVCQARQICRVSPSRWRVNREGVWDGCSAGASFFPIMAKYSDGGFETIL